MSATPSENSECSDGQRFADVCGDISSGLSHTRKRHGHYIAVVLCFFASTFGWPHLSVLSPFDIDVYLRTAPLARFSCVVQLSGDSCASPRWIRSSFRDRPGTDFKNAARDSVSTLLPDITLLELFLRGECFLQFSKSIQSRIQAIRCLERHHPSWIFRRQLAYLVERFQLLACQRDVDRPAVVFQLM